MWEGTIRPGAQRIGNNVSSKCTTQVLISTSPCSLRVFQQGKGREAWISPQLQLQIGRSLGSYSHVDKHQASSQQHPGFCGKVGDQLHLSFPSAVLAPTFLPSRESCSASLLCPAEIFEASLRYLCARKGGGVSEAARRKVLPCTA